MTTKLVGALVFARNYAKTSANPLVGDDPDDIAEVWNGVRDLFDFRLGGQLTARELDIVADEALQVWMNRRDKTNIHIVRDARTGLPVTKEQVSKRFES